MTPERIEDIGGLSFKRALDFLADFDAEFNGGGEMDIRDLLTLARALCEDGDGAIDSEQAAARFDAALRELDTPSVGVCNEVLAERQRQVGAEGWDREHDDEHKDGEIADAAACYAVGARDLYRIEANIPRAVWPYRWYFNPKSRRRDLIRAAALIVAEIERLDRQARQS